MSCHPSLMAHSTTMSARYYYYYFLCNSYQGGSATIFETASMLQPSQPYYCSALMHFWPFHSAKQPFWKTLLQCFALSMLWWKVRDCYYTDYFKMVRQTKMEFGFSQIC